MSYWNDFSFGQQSYGSQGQVFNEDDAQPSSSASLEDYLVYKPSSRKGKAWRLIDPSSVREGDILESDLPVHASNLPAPRNTTSASREAGKPTRADSATSYTPHLEPQVVASPVFDFPDNVYQDDGSFRPFTVNDGGMVVMQWSLAGMMWRNLGKISASKVQAFVRAMESIKVQYTDDNGHTDKSRYTRGVEDLITQIREGVMSPALHRRSTMDLMQSKQRLVAASPIDPFKMPSFHMSGSMAQAATQTSEERRRLAQDRGQLAKRSNDVDFTGHSYFAGLDHNQTELARRTGTLQSLREGWSQFGMVFPRPRPERDWTDPYKRRDSLLEPESGERRTVLHDPYKALRASVDATQRHASSVRPGLLPPLGSEAIGKEGWGMSAQDLRKSMYTPSAQDRPLSTQPGKSKLAELSSLTDDEVREATPLVPHCDPSGPFLSSFDGDDDGEEEQHDNQDSLSRDDNPVGDGRSVMSKASQANTSPPWHKGCLTISTCETMPASAKSLLKALYQNLFEYKALGRSRADRDYFVPFVQPPDWAIDEAQKGMGPIGEKSRVKSYFSHELASPEIPGRRRTPHAHAHAVHMPVRHKALVNMQRSTVDDTASSPPPVKRW